MATVNGTGIQVHGHTTPAGNTRKFSDGLPLMMCFIYVAAFTGTYAAADDATIPAKAAIEGSRRDGKTVTLVSAMCVAPGKEAGVVQGLGPAIAVSGANLVAQLTQADGTTERANGAMGAYDEGITIAVAYKINPTE